MNLQFLFFLIAEVAIALTAVNVDNVQTPYYGFVHLGVMSSQFAMLGVFLGIGGAPLRYRLGLTLVGVGGLIGMNLFRNPFNGWELLLQTVRLPVAAWVFRSIRIRKGVTLKLTDAKSEIRLFQFSVSRLFVLSFLGASIIGLLEILRADGGPVYDFSLLMFIVLIGVAGSLVPVLVATTVLSQPNLAAIAVSVLAVSALAFAMASFGYMAADSYEAKRWFSTTMVEATTMAVSLVLIQIIGFRLCDE